MAAPPTTQVQSASVFKILTPWFFSRFCAKGPKGMNLQCKNLVLKFKCGVLWTSQNADRMFWKKFIFVSEHDGDVENVEAPEEVADPEDSEPYEQSDSEPDDPEEAADWRQAAELELQVHVEETGMDFNSVTGDAYDVPENEQFPVVDAQDSFLVDFDVVDATAAVSAVVEPEPQNRLGNGSCGVYISWNDAIAAVNAVRLIKPGMWAVRGLSRFLVFECGSRSHGIGGQGGKVSETFHASSIIGNFRKVSGRLLRHLHHWRWDVV